MTRERTGQTQFHLVAAIVLLLIAWGVRLVAYRTGELGLDGHLSVGLALQPIPRLLDFLSRDVHPPFFYLALKAWLVLVGANDASARWPGVAAGVLTLAMLTRLLTTLAGARGALIAVGLLVLSPAMISASAAVRDFGLGLFFSVVSIAAWRALDLSRGTRRRWALLVLAVSTALALATWYFHLLVVAAQGVSLLAGSKNRREHILAVGAGLVVQLPWAVVALGPLATKVAQGVTVTGQPLAPVALRAILDDLGMSFAGELPFTNGPVVAFVAWTLIVGWGFAKAETEPGARRGWAITGFVALLIGLNAVYLIVSRWSAPTLLWRYGLVLLPWAALAQAWAFGTSQPAPVEFESTVRVRVGRRARQRPASPPRRNSSLNLDLIVPITLATVVVLAQSNDFLSLERLEGYPWTRQAVAPVPELGLLETAGRASDVVVFTDLARAGEYALRGRGQMPAVTIHIAGSAFLRDDVDSSWAALAPGIAERKRVWLLYDNPVDNASLASVVEHVGANRFLTREEAIGRSVVDRFELGPPVDRRPSTTHFGPEIGLTDWAISPSTAPGGMVYVDLRWKTLGAVDTDYTVFAHLLDGKGDKVAQHDGAPDFGLRPTTTWRSGEVVEDRIALLVPATAPLGTYQVVVGLYHGPARLPASTGGDSIALGSIEVRGP